MGGRGRFVTFEGIDGCGKTTIAQEVQRRLQGDGIAVMYTAEPTSSWIGRAVTQCYARDTDPLTDTFLFLADRVEHVRDIERWCADGMLVLSDRYMDSTCAYQSVSLRSRMDDPLAFLMELHEPFALRPDLTFIIDVAPEIAVKRISGRSRDDPPVKFERQTFLAAVREAYAALAARAESQGDARFRYIDGARDIDDIVTDICAILRAEIIDTG